MYKYVRYEIYPLLQVGSGSGRPKMTGSGSSPRKNKDPPKNLMLWLEQEGMLSRAGANLNLKFILMNVARYAGFVALTQLMTFLFYQQAFTLYVSNLQQESTSVNYNKYSYLFVQYF